MSHYDRHSQDEYEREERANELKKAFMQHIKDMHYNNFLQVYPIYARAYELKSAIQNVKSISRELDDT